MSGLILLFLLKRERKDIHSLYLNVMENVIPNIVSHIVNISIKFMDFLLTILLLQICFIFNNQYYKMSFFPGFIMKVN